MATSGLLKRLATNGREELRPSGVPAESRAGTQGKGTRIGLLWILGDVLIVLAALMIAVRGWLGQGLFGEDSPYRTNIMFHNHPTVLLGCLATRFPSKTLEWDATAVKVANVEEANRLVRKRYRKGWEVEGL